MGLCFASCAKGKMYPRSYVSFNNYQILLQHHFGNYIFERFSIYAVFTPIFIYSILFIFRYFSINQIKKGLSSLSKQSTYMWFLHGIFFTPNKVL